MQSCRIPVFDAYLLLFAAIYVEVIIYCFPLSFKEKFWQLLYCSCVAYRAFSLVIFKLSDWDAIPNFV